MVVGEQENAWGDRTTDNILKLEWAIAGEVALTIAGSDITLAEYDGGDGSTTSPVDQSAAMILNCGGAMSADVNIIVPNKSKLYLVNNKTTEDWSLYIKTVGGTGLEIPQDESYLVWCDGNDVIASIRAPSSGTVDLATNSLQLGGAVAALYALLDLRQTWSVPQTVLGATFELTLDAYTPDVATDTTLFLPQAEVTDTYTIQNPTGTPVPGQILIFHLEQHHTDVQSIIWGTHYLFINDEDVDVTQTIDTMDTFTFQYNSSLGKWICAGVAQNFARD